MRILPNPIPQLLTPTLPPMYFKTTVFRAAALAALVFLVSSAASAQGLGGLLNKANQVGNEATRVSQTVSRVLPATGKAAGSKSAGSQTAPAEPAAEPASLPATDESAAPASGAGSSASEAAAPPASAAPTTWVCTWCKEEFTGDKQPTSFQPGKCERNPGKAHAWHKK